MASTPLATAAGPEYFISEAQMQQRVRLRISDTSRFDMVILSESSSETRMLRESSSTIPTPRCTLSLMYETGFHIGGGRDDSPSRRQHAGCAGCEFAETFGGRVVRKDLVKKTKVGSNMQSTCSNTCWAVLLID